MVEAIANLPAPQNLAELRRLFGVVHYLARFVPNRSAVLQLLHNLLKKDVPFPWTTNQKSLPIGDVHVESCSCVSIL